MRAIFRIGLAVLSLTMFAVSASAAIPTALHYQGYMTTDAGEPVQCVDALNCPSAPDTFGMTFRLYDSLVGGVPLWQETHPTVAVEDGLFDVILGSLLPITITLPDTVYLGITLNNEAEASPRQKVVSAAFTMRASTADNATSLGGVSASNYVETAAIPGLCVTPTQLATYEVLDVLGVDGAGNVTVNGNAAMSPTGVWLGDTTVWNKSGSSVYYNGGNVGIGTAAPQNFKLVVSGDGGAVGHVAMFGSTASVGYLGVASLNTSHYIYSHDDGRFGVHVPGVGDKFTILGNGNLGIGTASPTEKLHVKGPIRSGNRLDIYEGSDTTRVGLLGAWNDLGGGSLPNSNDFVIKSGSGLGISFAPNNGGSAAYISSSGKVGIGETSPPSKLSVASSSTNNSAKFGRHAGDGLFLHSEASASHYNWRITTQTVVDGGFEIGPSVTKGGTDWASPTLVLKQNGNVGIGKTAPNAKLSLGNSTGKDKLLVYDGGGVNNLYAGFGIDTPALNDFTMYAHANGLLKFGNMSTNWSTITTWMTINNSGNVGIGTESPQHKLEVNGDLNVTGAIKQNGVPIGGGSGGGVSVITLYGGASNAPVPSNMDWWGLPNSCPSGWTDAGGLSSFHNGRPDTSSNGVGATNHQAFLRNCYRYDKQCGVMYQMGREEWNVQWGYYMSPIPACPSGWDDVNTKRYPSATQADVSKENIIRTCVYCP